MDLKPESTSRHPWAVPPDEIAFTCGIRIQAGMSTPAEITAAIARSLAEYATERNGTMTPFAQQTGYPQGVLKDSAGNTVGVWEVKGLAR